MGNPARINPDMAASLAAMALSGLRREYPNQIAHAMSSDADAGTPRSLHPAFFGCFDWHSAVHGHWCLVRLLRQASGAAWEDAAVAGLNAGLTVPNIDAEVSYLRAPGRAGFERPYGLAWVLQLHAELRDWRDPRAATWARALAPLTEACMERLGGWLERLTHPVRTGVHSQSAFAMSLALDWARDADERFFASMVRQRALDLYGNDAGWPLAFEPSGEDFLSPSLSEADLMRRVLDRDAFARWLHAFLPTLAGHGPMLTPVVPLDSSDGRLAHLHGLNLSRAWMAEAIADSLPAVSPSASWMRTVASEHLAVGLEGLSAEDYGRAHWLATFAVYALTGRGRPAVAGARPRAS